MFRDRDLFLLGAGALLSVFCLFLPLSFVAKLAAGMTTLVGFMALAFLRLGPDRVPPEEWLLRRLRFWLSPRRFVYQRQGWKLPPRRAPAAEPAKKKAAAPPSSRRARQANLRPLTLALPERGVYPLASLLLAVLGIYFVAWLAQGGAVEIASVFR